MSFRIKTGKTMGQGARRAWRTALLGAAYACALPLLAAPPAGKHEKPEHEGHPGGPPWREMDTNKDGKISKAEWDAFHARIFSEIDKNGDGSLDQAEFRAHHAGHHGPGGGH